MKRGLNNIEKKNLKLLKDLGYTPEIVEYRNWNDTYTYHAVLRERKYQVSLSSPGDLSSIPPAKSKK